MIHTYEEYKDSGVDWLGEIPAGWELTSLRSMFIFRNEKNDPIITENILSLSIANGVTPYSDYKRGGNKAKSDLTAYKIARPGDIVINSMNVIVGAVGLSKYFGAISPVYYAIFPRDKGTEIKFYENVFHNASFQRGLLRLGKGILIKKGESGKLNTIRMKISVDDLKVIKLPRPPLPEQLAIAEFLDEKTTKIDELVGIKQRQIELLAERKQILIQNAVTKGLSPDTPMKDSGVDWIGPIPAHWEVKRLASFGRFSKGGGFSKSDLAEVGIDAILYGDIYTQYDFVIDRAVRTICPKIANKSVWIKQGDLLFTGSGETKEDIGKCVLYRSPTKAVSGGDVILFRQSENNSLYLSFCLNSYGSVGQKAMSSKGEIIVHTYASKLKNIFIPIPPADEQGKIAKFIWNGIVTINVAIDIKQNQIAKLNEYKTTLINAAVTGKIKVV